MKAAGNLEVVKGVVGASARGDFSDASWADPGIEFVVDDSLSRETWSGIANLGEGWLARGAVGMAGSMSALPMSLLTAR
jgi:hypothetical protein